MDRFARLLGVLLATLLVQACVVVPPPDPKEPDKTTRRLVAKRVGAVVVTHQESLRSWVSNGFSANGSPGDADGGSATPISPDGYFLTADHVLAQVEGKNVFVLFGRRGSLEPLKARVVWRDPAADIAVLKVNAATPHYYHWTSPQGWLPVGTPVIHGGIATGFKSKPGRMGTTLEPEGRFTSHRSFKIDIPLQPGDSGGPVVDAYGNLVGINTAVEFLVPMETPFFVDSEGNRPNTRMIDEVVREDRAKHGGGAQ